MSPLDCRGLLRVNNPPEARRCTKAGGLEALAFLREAVAKIEPAAEGFEVDLIVDEADIAGAGEKGGAKADRVQTCQLNFKNMSATKNTDMLAEPKSSLKAELRILKLKQLISIYKLNLKI